MAFNLHAIAAPFAAVVTGQPDAILWKQALPYTTADNGKQIPQYADPVPLPDGRVQALDPGELEQLDALNVVGIRRGVWASIDLSAGDRGAKTGGDLLSFNGSVWLVVHVFETWDQSGWCHVAVTKQLDPLWP